MLVAMMLAVAPGLTGPAAGGGDAEIGRAVWVSKRCGRCHAPRGEPGRGPALEEVRRPQGEMELAGRLWNHVPVMFSRLAIDGVEWPSISITEMADLMAYLGAAAARDPAPDLFKGQVMVLRKGCLKCHSLRREGGRIEPDLADRRADYASAAAWAAAMWTHTPRMAAMAARAGVAYPRFSGDEMGNLLGFLRSAADSAPERPTPARRSGTEGGGR
jgi:cytochrome c551/c552